MQYRNKKLLLISPFMLGLLLGVSIMAIPLAFAAGDIERGYNATGAEVFTIALPFLVVAWRAWSMKYQPKRRLPWK